MTEVDEAELNELLEDSLEDGSNVAVTVRWCEYRCCGGGWGVRDYDEPQQYAGRVLSIGVDQFLLQVPPKTGKGAEVIARFDALVSVVPIVD